MNNFFSYLRLLLLATSGMLLLCIIFAMNPELADGTLSGKAEFNLQMQQNSD